MPAITSATVHPSKPTASSRAIAVFARGPMVGLTFVLVLIAFRYLTNPLHAASAAGIAFTSPGGITVARVGFAGFPLAFAAFFLSCLFSQDRVLWGLRTELTLLGSVMSVRVLGMALAHSAETVNLLIPEAVMAVLCIVAIRLEIGRRKRERTVGLI